MSTIKRDHRFTVTPEHLICDPRISDRAFRLWCRLDRYAGDKGGAYPSREALAIELDTSPASIDRATKELIQSGWLEVEERPGTSSNYVLMNAPTKATMKLIEDSRKERRAATEPRRAAKAAQRRKQKDAAKVQSSAKAQVSDGGFITGDDTPKSGADDGGFITGAEPGFITGAERGFITGDAQKEASLEGSIIEGHPNPSLRSGLTSADASAESDGSLVLLNEIHPDFAGPKAPAPTFEDFYAVYPRHVGKQAAKKAWDAAVKLASPAFIVEGARKFAADPNLPTGADAHFVPHPSSWLRAGRWDDEPLPPRNGSGRGQAYSDAATWGTEDQRVARAEERRRAEAQMTPEQVQAHLDSLFGEQTG